MTDETATETITRKAPLASDFGRDMARRYFPAEKINELPYYERGPNAGRQKGWITWTREKRADGLPGRYVSIKIEIYYNVYLELDADEIAAIQAAAQESENAATPDGEKDQKA